MSTVFSNKKHLKIIFGIPIFLLVFAYIFQGKFENNTVFENSFNPYLKTLPSKYISAISNSKENYSTFSVTTFQDGVIRELIVFKRTPNQDQITSDFLVKIIPSKNKKDSLNLSIINDAVLYNFRDKTYAVFRIPLPLIDIEKIHINQKLKYKNQKGWSAVLSTPFPLIEKIILPQNKSYINKDTPNLYSALYFEELNRYDIKSLPTSLAVSENSLFQVREKVSDYMLSEKLTLGKIVKPTLFWNLTNTKDQNLINLISFSGINSKEAIKYLQKFIDGKIDFESTFNIQKLAYYHAFKNLYTSGCNDDFFLLYNDINNKFEPFFVASKCLGELGKFISKPKIQNNTYLNTYILALNEVSEMDLIENNIKGNKALEERVRLMNKFFPKKIFDIDILLTNQKIINKSLSPSTAIKPEIITVNKDRMIVSILNTSSYPVYITELNHQAKKNIAYISPRPQILSGQKDTIEISLPRSFENLFVSKKNKEIGFSLPKHIYELYIGYSILGLEDIQYSNIIPYQAKQKVKEDLFREPINLKGHDGIVVNKEKKVVTFYKDSVTISSALMIPKGYQFKLRPGANINIVKGGKIISYGPLKFNGNKENPINIYSSDRKGQGLLVLSDGMESNLNYVNFNHLTFPKHGSWSVTGAVTFYESPVKLNHVSVENNSCEDALNIVRTEFTMKNSRIANTQSDAFDGDFVKGLIINCSFNNLGNDAIDVSGSELTIKQVVVSDAGDKGLSAGEDSKMIIDGVHISNSEIAVAGKDLSVVEIKNLKINNTKLGFTAFQKKPEFGPSNITVNGIVMQGVETKYLIERSSSLFVDGVKIETSQNVIDRMYGAEFGRSSAETRNSQ
ncbi:hypothetical protein GCM10023311_14680 [Flaviramulus aquimarinus]|uniref:Right handed beta helix domain-containing protein n=1 Tax=Flaviramulus aquimarinus TaxID=1170456 RepID=A0ABP9F0E4_9FLAO